MSTTPVDSKKIPQNESVEPTKKIAVVTGANKPNGIGFAIVRALAKDKNITVVFTSREKESGEKALKLHQAAGLDNVEFVVLDVADDKSVKITTESILAKHKRVDILINNAGIFPGVEFATKGFNTDIALLERMLQVNTYGALRMINALVPTMIANNYGRVVNMSSHLASTAFDNGGMTGYRITKNALNNITKTLSEDTKDKNVLVNAMSPGLVDTDMVPSYFTEMGPIKKCGPEKAADTAVWLATLTNDEKAPRGKFFFNRDEIPW
jgi:NAD(P)-dependent dehydrogenase (short-subunit alcohol dehydrogenase family)